MAGLLQGIGEAALDKQGIEALSGGFGS